MNAIELTEIKECIEKAECVSTESLPEITMASIQHIHVFSQLLTKITAVDFRHGMLPSITGPSSHN